MNREPEEYQEVHSPTELVENVVSHHGRRSRAAYRQRKVDKRLLESLEPHQLEAWAEIARVWHYITFGMTAKAQTFERIDPGRGNIGEIGHKLTKQWRIWRARVSPEDRSVSISIICEGRSPYAAGRDRGKGSGWGRAALGRALNTWDEIGQRC